MVVVSGSPPPRKVCGRPLSPQGRRFLGHGEDDGLDSQSLTAQDRLGGLGSHKVREDVGTWDTVGVKRSFYPGDPLRTCNSVTKVS